MGLVGISIFLDLIDTITLSNSVSVVGLKKTTGMRIPSRDSVKLTSDVCMDTCSGFTTVEQCSLKC